MADAPAPTFKDIARAARVSVSAVSLALRDRPGVSEATRKRVKAWARRLGYHQDAVIAQAMVRVRRTGAGGRGLLPLAILHGFPMRLPLRGSSEFGEFWGRAQERARELGYHLEEFWMREPGVTSARLRQILQARGIRGIIFSQPLVNAAGRLEFDLEGFCAVNSGACGFTPQIHSVVSHHTQMARLAFEQALARGYRRLGLVLQTGPEWSPISDTEAEYWAYVGTGRLPASLPVHRSRMFEEDRGEFLDWVRREQPEVVIGPPALLRWLRAGGVRVPGAVAFIGNGRTDHGDCSGVDNRNVDQAVALVDLLVAHLHRGEFGVPPFAKTVMIQGAWVEGGTLPPRRAEGR